MELPVLLNCIIFSCSNDNDRADKVTKILPWSYIYSAKLRIQIIDQTFLKKVNSLICFDGTSIIQWLHIPFDSDRPKPQVEIENNELDSGLSYLKGNTWKGWGRAVHPRHAGESVTGGFKIVRTGIVCLASLQS